MRQVQFQEAIDVLRRGDILLYPTETLYGMGVDIQNRSALAKVFDYKSRAVSKAISVLVPDSSSIKKLVKELSSISLFLIENFLPGPLTLVLPAAAHLPKEIVGEAGWVGIRMSSHPLASQLVRSFGSPITTTSANLSGQESGRTPWQLRESFGEREDVFLLSGGELPASPGSTVVQVEGESLKLLREGEIKFTEIESRLRDFKVLP